MIETGRPAESPDGQELSHGAAFLIGCSVDPPMHKRPHPQTDGEGGDGDMAPDGTRQQGSPANDVSTRSGIDSFQASCIGAS